MRISNIGKIPVTTHKVAKVEHLSPSPKTLSPTNNRDTSLTISPQSWQKLKESEEAIEQKRSKLPKHIQDMIKAIERIIEQIEIAKEMLAKAKETDYSDEKTKQAAIASQQGFLNSLEAARFDAIQALQQAMTDAGIDDVSIITDLLR